MNPIGKVYTKPAGTSEWPAIVCSQPAGRVAYLAGLFSEFYGVYRMEDLEQLLVDVVKWAHGEPLPVRVRAPRTVEVECYTQPEHKRMVLHLVNNTADMQRPMCELIPVHDIEIELDCGEVASVRSERGSDVTMEWVDGGVRLKVPVLEVYDLIIIEMG